MKEYIAVFFTHSGAIKFNRKAKKNNIHCELMPVPRKLSSNCGIGAKFSYEDDIANIIDEEIEKIFKVNDKEYILVYTES
ncbi:DUF3343 domain-containing protein [Crassaminicella thermophila]|uniref:DUF3343 domain-containing protein n=1 Tax=Crassaminicella thermophila TaxID=2599308 RepID=A0A5C0SHI1_CRATE|nr:DUF3343 domain-containing protein [Crassaminicella thermophila]QEK13442.1 DUF3343 domain-containing protein [Crassaminicella thermophila]